MTRVATATLESGHSLWSGACADGVNGSNSTARACQRITAVARHAAGVLVLRTAIFAVAVVVIAASFVSAAKDYTFSRRSTPLPVNYSSRGGRWWLWIPRCVTPFPLQQHWLLLPLILQLPRTNSQLDEKEQDLWKQKGGVRRSGIEYIFFLGCCSYFGGLEIG